MNITLNNYEEYFLLLADNELSPAEEALVRQFAEQHLPLQDELQLLLSCRLDAADMPVFPKEALFHPTIWNIENPAPVHTQMLNLLDDELPVAEKEKLQQQIAASPVLKAEWNTLQKAVLPAESIAYPDKTDLYRQHKIRPLVWMRWAAAAAVIALAWLLWPAQINNNGLSVGMIAAIPATNQNAMVPAKKNNLGVKDTNATQQNTNSTSTNTVAVAKPQSTYTLQKQNDTQKTIASIKQNKTPVKQTERALFKKEVIVPEPEELAIIEPNIETLGDNNSLVATLSKEENLIVQTAQLAPKANSLSANALQSTMTVNADEPDEHEGYVQIAGARFDKHKVRGLFRGITRSVTRTFSKSKIQPAETAYTTRNL